MERFWGRPSRGEQAARGVFRLARAVSDFAEPSYLWAVYASGDIANAYATPRSRCDRSQPAFNAEAVVGDCTKVASDPESERQWQREELARLILNWERWDEDREAWRVRVERDWIPRVEETVMRFDVAAYTEEIRKKLVPWTENASV